jgi:hypothetical protein
MKIFNNRKLRLGCTAISMSASSFESKLDGLGKDLLLDDFSTIACRVALFAVMIHSLQSRCSVRKSSIEHSLLIGFRCTERPMCIHERKVQNACIRHDDSITLQDKMRNCSFMLIHSATNSPTNIFPIAVVTA